MSILPFLLILGGSLLLRAHADDACYAPPFVYGGECKASTGVIGSPGLKITYSIDQVNNVGTLICCKALGCGSVTDTDCSTWGTYDLGCSSSSIVASLLWGNNAATPAIQCYGNPTGTSIQWSYGLYGSQKQRSDNLK